MLVSPTTFSATAFEMAASAVLAQPKFQDGLVQQACSILMVASVLYVSFHLGSISERLGQLQDNLQAGSEQADSISARCARIERRLMSHEFSPYECQRQIKGATQSWDFSLDPECGPRKVFQEIGKYSRNFVSRTGQPVSSTQLSLIINMALQTCGSGPSAPAIISLQHFLYANWHLQLPGQPQNGYDGLANLSNSQGNLTQEQLVDFYSFRV